MTQEFLYGQSHFLVIEKRLYVLHVTALEVCSCFSSPLAAVAADRYGFRFIRTFHVIYERGKWENGWREKRKNTSSSLAF